MVSECETAQSDAQRRHNVTKFGYRVKSCEVCSTSFGRQVVASRAYCKDCRKWVMWVQQRVTRAVREAIKIGILDRPETQACVDCGKRAEYYEHRHYMRPLDVVPVCIRCNQKRGIAHDIGDIVRRLQAQELPAYG